MKYYADFKHDVGFRCHPCNVLESPFWDDLAMDTFCKIHFIEILEGTIDKSQIICCVPIKHIFDQPIELVDLPSECYW